MVAESTLRRLEAEFDTAPAQLQAIVDLLDAGASPQFVALFRRDETGDPWDGRTLEWSTSSPPPDYNFAFTPVVHELDAWHHMKKLGVKRPTSGFTDIHMPANTAAGVVIAGLSTLFGFAMIWHMWLVAGVSFLVTIVAILVHTFNYKRDYYIQADAVKRSEDARTAHLAALAAR